MGNMSIRNIPADAHEALRLRAQHNGRSVEAEVRALIVEAARAAKEGGFGTRLRRCFKGIEGDELDLPRDKTPAEPLALK